MKFIKFNNVLINPKRVDYIQKCKSSLEGINRIHLSVGGNSFYEICSSTEIQEQRYQELIKQFENA